MPKPKQPRLIDETYQGTNGKRRKRYTVRLRYGRFYYVWDLLQEKLVARPVSIPTSSGYPYFWKLHHRSRKSAWNWLRRTTVRWYKIQEVNAMLDRDAA